MMIAEIFVRLMIGLRLPQCGFASGCGHPNVRAPAKVWSRHAGGMRGASEQEDTAKHPYGGSYFGAHRGWIGAPCARDAQETAQGYIARFFTGRLRSG